MLENVFFINGIIKVTYSEIFSQIHNSESFNPIVHTSDFAKIFSAIVQSIIYDIPITLLDYDFSKKELLELGFRENDLNNVIELDEEIIIDENNFYERISKSKNWSISLFTSGTTGLPKKVVHSFESITRVVKQDESKKNDIWGFAYNPTHIAGLQVFFQAFLNKNTIVNLFGKSRREIFSNIEKYRITNISATPSFYRMILPLENKYDSVKRITFGGEKFDRNLAENLSLSFPNAKILNVYASTEAGTVLAAKGDYFEISEKNRKFVKIENDELYVHSSMLGQHWNLEMQNEWYATGDLVEVIKNVPLTFKFVQRKNEMINVGGYKVNPNEVEAVINSHDGISTSKVYSKKNSILGNLMVADVVKNRAINEKDLRSFLENRLQSFKVPRVIKFVEEIELTRTGKLKRT